MRYRVEYKYRFGERKYGGSFLMIPGLLRMSSVESAKRGYSAARFGQ